MKALYLGCYAGYSGYAQAALDTILALDAAGVKVAARHVMTHPRQRELPEAVRLMERTKFATYDAVIHHLPPYMASYDARAGLNVTVFYTETHPLPKIWAARAALMDLVLAPSDYEVGVIKGAMAKLGSPTAVEKVHIPCDVSRYERSYSSRSAEKLNDGRFTFYTIGELVARKNLAGLLRAFYSEFSPHEPVKLVVKTNLVGLSPAEVEAKVGAVVREAKENLKLYRDESVYDMERVVLGSLPEADLMALHAACDCYVQPSRGESWNIPAHDAMGMGKTPILTACGGHLEYLDDATGWLVPARPEPVSGDWSVHPELYNARQTWHAPDLLSLRKAMREAYENPALRKQKSDAGRDRVYDFSHEAVGQRLRGVLEKYGR
jgi:glycosyltransferase involved in cell wall biosynthesis